MLMAPAAKALVSAASPRNTGTCYGRPSIVGVMPPTVRSPMIKKRLIATVGGSARHRSFLQVGQVNRFDLRATVVTSRCILGFSSKTFMGI
jgi:hypothetical protein